MAKNGLTASFSSFGVGKGYFRSSEWGALLLLVLMIAVTGYLSVGVLGERAIRANELQVQDLQLRHQITEMQNSNAKKNKLALDKNDVLDRLEQFNEKYLKDERSGRIALIDLLNKLIKKNDLGFQGAITFQQIEDADVVAAREALEKKTRAKRSDKESLDLFPGLHATFAVSGNYESIRAFLHDLETSNLFLIIQRLDLQTQESGGNSPSGNRAPVLSNVPPGTLNVQVEVKSYFRKEPINNAFNQ